MTDRPSTAFARVMFAAHDMNALAELGSISIEQWHAAPPGPQALDAHNSVMLDLMSDEHTIDDESSFPPRRSRHFSWPVEEVVQRGRQAVARQLDEDRLMLMRRVRACAE